MSERVELSIMRSLLVLGVVSVAFVGLSGCADTGSPQVEPASGMKVFPPPVEAHPALASAGAEAGELGEVTVDYPLDGSVFPPDIVAPTFLWHDDSPEADRWLIDVSLGDGSSHIAVVTDGPPVPTGEIDARCIMANNELYEPTPYQASAHSWTPSDEIWEAIKAGSSGRPAIVTVLGFNSAQPDKALARGGMTLTTSTDPVGAPIFYRDVPLMPSKTEKGNIKPIPDYALRLVIWRLRDISRRDNRAVLTDIPTCANCHSFSADGGTIAMDIDGPSGDKGAYGIATVCRNTVISASDIITWNSFADKPRGHKTIGFLSRISPDGQYALSTVNEKIFSAGFPHYEFLQVFYPTRGILAYYSRKTARFEALPGADDPDYVHCDPVWSPDGEWIVFARAEARDPYVEGWSDAVHANHENETPMQYDLYRMPFNDGRGGAPERIEGASQNGMSNTFAKVSPDGKWIVFVKCRNGQLQRPDSRLWIVPATGGQAREMNCNMSLMNSWHSFSPNGRWMVFSSKANTPYTEMFLTHLDEDGNDSPPILIANSTASNRAVNLPEFINIDYDDLLTISAPTIEYYRHYERGNALRDEERFEEAAAEYRLALAAEPTSTRVNNNLGLCLVRMGRYEQAAEHYRTALDLFPDDPRSVMLYCNLGYALAAQKRLDEAIVQYLRALELDPRHLTTHLNLASALAGQGKVDQAIELCHTALEIDPKSARAHYELGQLYYNTNQLHEAITHWRKTIEINPEYIVAYSSMGAAMARLGDVAGAIREYEKALAVNPDHIPARINLGFALDQQGKHDEAIQQFRKALAVAPDSVYLLNRLGIALGRQGQFDEAVALFTKAAEIDPDDVPTRVNLSSTLSKQGKHDEAIQQLRTALSVDPDNVNVLNRLGAALARQGQIDEAIVLLTRAVEIDPNNAGTRRYLDAAIRRRDGTGGP